MMPAHDLRYAVRSLRRSPVFLAVAVVSLGLGLGLTTTMFSMLDAVVNPYVPYREPDRLVSITPYGTGYSGTVGRQEILEALVEGSSSFDGVAASVGRMGLVQAGSFASDYTASLVTDNYFPLLGLRPESGRLFVPDDDPGAAVISYAFWRRVFAGRPLSDGLSFTFEDRQYHAIGIMPYEARGTFWARRPGLGDDPGDRARLFPIARLKSGVTRDAANAELAVIAARLALTYGSGRQPFSFQVRPLVIQFTRELEDYHAALAGGAAAVLLLACANLANLLLARGLNRRRELALRRALGATRGALMRQILAESAIVGAAGAVLGTALALWGIGVLRSQLPAEIMGFGRIVPHLSWRVFAFVLLAGVFSIVLFGLWPAVRATGISLTAPLKDGAGTTTGRVRQRYSPLVISEVAVCLAVLMGAALLTRALNRVESLRLGFDPTGVLSAGIRLSARSLTDDAKVPAAVEGIVAGLKAVPGVVEVATTGAYVTPHRAITSDAEGAEPVFTNVPNVKMVSPGFLHLMRIPVLQGRDFEPGDGQASAVAIVDQVAAERLWGNRSPVGRMIKLGGPSTDAPWVPVVGVVRAVRLGGGFWDPYQAGAGADPVVYVVRPNDATRARQVVVRVTGDQAAAIVALREVLRVALSAWDRNVWGGGRFTPYLESFRDLLESRRFLAGVFSAFALFSLLLAAVGMYGVLAYAVGQRMREFAVRVALGARAGDLRRLVLHDGAVMFLAGTGIGAWLAMTGSTLLDYWLYDLDPTDAVSLVAAEAVLILIAFAACLAPARRAARADPLEIIRAN